MIWTVWNNGAHHPSGAGYGFKLNAADRDQYFRHDWKTVVVHLPSPTEEIEVEVNVAKASFWNESCRELINKKIGRWLLANHYAPWPVGSPPRFEVQPAGDRHFNVIERL